MIDDTFRLDWLEAKKPEIMYTNLGFELGWSVSADPERILASFASTLREAIDKEMQRVKDNG
jgi:hypothetical protein